LFLLSHPPDTTKLLLLLLLLMTALQKTTKWKGTNPKRR
jgi:hypothetical protein